MKKTPLVILAALTLPAALLLPVAAAHKGCPPPLPPGVYATRCTGGTIRLEDGTEHRDCRRGERPAHAMAPKLVRLVERLRCEVGDKVVITSGYRSPRHNLYLWAHAAAGGARKNPVSRKSRHMTGKAVDFYVRGYGYGKLTALAPVLRRWAGRLAAPLRGSAQSVWIKVYKKTEGREPDNMHPFPYLHVELRE